MKSLSIRFAVVILSTFFMIQSHCYAVSKAPASLSSTAGITNYLKDVPAIKNITTWTNPYAPGVTIQTAHYKIHTTMYEPLMLRQVPSFMESAYAAYNSQLPYPIKTHTPFTIYLFADRRQWESFTKSFTGNAAAQYLAIKEGAYFLNGACVVYNIGRKQTFSVLGHEGWHQFNNKHFTYRLPSWLDEGIATLFEVSEPVNGKFVFNPAGNFERLVNLKYGVMSYNLIPLDQLITLNPGQIISLHNIKRNDARISEDDITKMTIIYYAQCYALARFLREDEYGKRISKYHAMLLGGLDGTWPLNNSNIRTASDRNIPLTVKWNSYISPKLFDIYIQEDRKQLQREYEAFCKKIVYKIRTSTTTTSLK